MHRIRQPPAQDFASCPVHDGHEIQEPVSHRYERKGGDDTLKGNGGADVFQFRASDRNDTILDFRQGQDLNEIQTGANSFAALDIEQDGQDVLIGFGTGQVRIVTDSVGAFDENDFIF